MAIYTDERLADMAASAGPGPRRAAAHLRKIADPEARDKIVTEATVMMHMAPGWPYSAAIGHQVNAWLAGTFSPYYTEANRKMIAEERARRDADRERLAIAMGARPPC